MTKEEFIHKARQVHGDKYDYSEVVYVNHKTPVKIICPVHGGFWQNIYSHLYNKGCSKCANEARFKWSKENIIAESRKYQTTKDFREGNLYAYMIARNNNWLQEFTWLDRTTVVRGYWQVKENVLEESKKYKTRKEFQLGSNCAYNVAWKKGWLDEMTWFEKYEAPVLKWTKEKVFEESRKYNSRSGFERGSHGAYERAKVNHWLDEMTWLTTPVHVDVSIDDLIYCIYAYIDDKEKAVYVGLTKNLKQRKYQHRTGIGKGSSVHKHFGDNVPEPVILMSKLNYEDAQFYEDKFIKDYQADGWRVLNRAATGKNVGSIGAAVLKWDDEAIEKEARKYRTKIDFKKGNGAACTMAYKRGLMDSFDWFEDGKKLTKEEVIERSKKYKTLKDFKNDASSTYGIALKNGWLKDLVWLEREVRSAWNYDECRQEALKYTKKKDFRTKSRGAYSAATKNHWIKDFDWLEDGCTPGGFWTRDRVFEESRKYTSRRPFKLNASGAYRAAEKNGWLDEMTWLVPKCKKWTKEEIFAEARKYSRKVDFYKNANSAYSYAIKKGWVSEMTWFNKK